MRGVCGVCEWCGVCVSVRSGGCGCLYGVWVLVWGVSAWESVTLHTPPTHTHLPPTHLLLCQSIFLIKEENFCTFCYHIVTNTTSNYNPAGH